MNKYSGKTNRQLIEMLVDQVQQLYTVVADNSRRITAIERRLDSIEARLDILEAKSDRLIDSVDELFMWNKKYNALANNHEFRITKLETA